MFESHSFSSICEAVFCHASARPDAFFCADAKQSYTYASGSSAISRAAGAVRRLGVRKGDRVMVESTQSVQTVLTEMAVQSLGAVFVPFEAKAPAERIADIQAETEPVLNIGLTPRCEGVPFVSFDDLFAAEEPLPEGWQMPARDDLAEILYTTGTTGKAKGIEITHANNLAIAENIAGSVRMESGNVELIPILMSHSHALRTTYAAFLTGNAVVIADGVTFMRPLFDLIERYGVNALDLVPSALRILLKLGAKKLAAFAGRIRYVELGSAPLTELDKQSLRACLPGARMYNFYGSTESGRTVAYEFSEDKPANGCIGLPACNAKVLFVNGDGENVSATDPEHTGYLMFEGPMNMRGYWRAPELTAGVLINGRIRTKDVGYQDANGLVYMLGRDDDVINSGGVKISPDDVEAACLRCPEVEDCGCIGVDDPLQGQTPMLFVALKPGSSFTEAEIIAYMKNNFDKDKLPKKISLLDKMPRTANGKLLRRELRKLVQP